MVADAVNVDMAAAGFRAASIEAIVLDLYAKPVVKTIASPVSSDAG